MRSTALPLLRALLVPVLVTLAGAPVAAQPAVTHADGVPAHGGLDAVYERFAAAYDALDAATMGQLYTEGALYLPAGNSMQRGRETIEAGFTSFFDRVRADGGKLAISFEILDRQVAEALATDVGIYTLRRVRADGMRGDPDSPDSRGKFTVVALRDPSGDGWRFHVDSFSPLDGIRCPP